MAVEAAAARTPLHDCHRRAGARMVEFAGWEMPVHYSGVMQEHRAVRQAAGLFDVSHMGEIAVRGPRAVELVERLTPNHVARLPVGRAHYSGLLTERGTYLDDLLVYRLGEEDLLLVVNAANREEDVEWVRDRAFSSGVTVEDASERYALLALQGPAAAAILAPLTPLDLDALGYYGFAPSEVAGRPALVSRTGYTGEDGFELYVSPEDAPALWERLSEAGGPRGLVPAGLGARDTLRLEAGMALYGHELDDTTTPFEAGLGWVVKLDKGEFVGRDALLRQQQEGLSRRLVGFEVTGRGIARQGTPVVEGGRKVGEVTSGTFSPWFEKALGMAYVPARLADPGRELELELRGRALPAAVVELPFYRRPQR